MGCSLVTVIFGFAALAQFGRTDAIQISSCKARTCECDNLSGNVMSLNTMMSAIADLTYSEWEKASNSRYYKVFRAGLNFQWSRDHCQEIGGHLITIGMRNATIRKEILDMLSISTEAVWIGLSDLEEEGNWMWDDGVNGTNADWGPGEPDSASEAEDCAAYFTASDQHIVDIDCTRSFTRVCETVEFV